MASNAAANLIEKLSSGGDNAATAAANPDVDISKFADTSTKMMALAWMGKKDVEISVAPLIAF